MVGVFALVALGLTPSAVRGQAAPPPRPQRAALTLSQLLDSVQSGHPLVAAAMARARAALGSRATARTFANPILSYQVENAPFPGGAAPPMEREAMTTMTLPLEPLYQRNPRLRRADAELRAASNDVAATRQRVALDASHAYYRAALAQVSLAAARDLVDWLDTLVAYNRVRAAEGATSESDLLRTQLERDRAAAEAAMREADWARARSILATFLGETVPNVASQLRVATDDAPLAMPPGLDGGPVDDRASSARSEPAVDTLPSGAIQSALTHRSDIVAARERLTASNAAVSAERSMLVRQLGVVFGAKRSIGTTSMIAGVSLPFPLFDQNRGEIARAAAERNAAAFEVAAQERSARADLSGGYEAARILTRQASELADRGDTTGTSGYLARADEARRIALGAYREGGIPLLQLLDAARAWGEARVAFYTTVFAQHESVIELIAAQGIDLYMAIPKLTHVRHAPPSR